MRKPTAFDRVLLLGGILALLAAGVQAVRNDGYTNTVGVLLSVGAGMITGGLAGGLFDIVRRKNKGKA